MAENFYSKAPRAVLTDEYAKANYGERSRLTFINLISNALAQAVREAVAAAVEKIEKHIAGTEITGVYSEGLVNGLHRAVALISESGGEPAEAKRT